MRVALLSPLPPEQNGIADYADNWRRAVAAQGVEVLTPFFGLKPNASWSELRAWVRRQDWSGIDVVHTELGGGRLREFIALEALQQLLPGLPKTVTVHDPERLIWRPEALPFGLDGLQRLSRRAYQAAVVLSDPLTLRRERRVAAACSRLITLTTTGARVLARRMHLQEQRITVIPHGHQEVPPQPMPPLQPLRLLYFGFIYRGKGIEDLLDALALLLQRAPELRERLQLTLAGGSVPEMAFGGGDDYLGGLRRRLAEHGLQDRVEMRIDIAPDAIAPLIQAHHLMVLPYRESKKLAILGQQRGTSGALSWANACGRPALTSDARAFAEEVSSGNGAVFVQGDVNALAARLEDLVRQPQQVLAWAEQSAQLALARRWSNISRRFVDVWDNVLSSSGDGP